jgi:hypothetical protein
MKKIIIGLSGLVLISFVVILFVNAEISTKEVKKSTKECTMVSAKCASTATCDSAKCKEMGCDPAKCKEGKCDPASCKASIAGGKCVMASKASSGCPATCPMAKVAR